MVFARAENRGKPEVVAAHVSAAKPTAISVLRPIQNFSAKAGEDIYLDLKARLRDAAAFRAARRGRVWPHAGKPKKSLPPGRHGQQITSMNLMEKQFSVNRAASKADSYQCYQ
jgi:hypothetical protein